MQYLLITKKDTLSDIAKVVGQSNIDLILSENGLKRTPKIGQQWYDKCAELIAQTPNEVTASRKTTLLNGLTHSQEVFEKACLMDEDEWKVFSTFQSFPDALRVPESIELPYSTKVIGARIGDVVAASIGSNAVSTSVSTSTIDPVDPVTYRSIMKGLQKSPYIDAAVFNTVNTSPPVKLDDRSKIETKTPQYSFNLPWGKIQMYSTLLKETMDFPAYPEHIDTSRNATYTSMPDTIYQYEPWIVYQSSGPREQSLEFHLHRDMWTGNHLDGNAENLVKFCEANTFPDYRGSAVLTPLVRIYIDGSLFISGVLTATTTNWTGPLGLDNWYLEFTLSLVIQEVSETALNIHSVRQFGLKGV